MLPPSIPNPHEEFHNTKKLFAAIKRKDTRRVKRLIPVSDLKQDGQFVLSLAAQLGRVDYLEWFISALKTPSEEALYNALGMAALNNHLKATEFLLSFCKDSIENERALHCAVGAGNIECVKAILPHANSRWNHHRSLTTAISRENRELIGLLLEKADDEFKSTDVLWYTIIGNKAALIEEFLPMTDLSKWSASKWDYLDKSGNTWLAYLKSYMLAQEEKTQLASSLIEASHTKPKAKL